MPRRILMYSVHNSDGLSNIPFRCMEIGEGGTYHIHQPGKAHAMAFRGLVATPEMDPMGPLQVSSHVGEVIVEVSCQPFQRFVLGGRQDSALTSTPGHQRKPDAQDNCEDFEAVALKQPHEALSPLHGSSLL